MWSDLILTCHKEMNRYMKKDSRVHSFSFYGPCILEREHRRESKIYYWNQIDLNCRIKVATADLCKICLKMKEWCFREINELNFPARAGPCPALDYPSAPRKVHLWCIFFALPAMSFPLPAVLKVRENTAGPPDSSNFLNFPWRFEIWGVNCIYCMRLYNCFICGTVFCPLQSWQTKSVFSKCQQGRLHMYIQTKNLFRAHQKWF